MACFSKRSFLRHAASQIRPFFHIAVDLLIALLLVGFESMDESRRGVAILDSYVECYLYATCKHFTCALLAKFAA